MFIEAFGRSGNQLRQELNVRAVKDASVSHRAPNGADRVHPGAQIYKHSVPNGTVR